MAGRVGLGVPFFLVSLALALPLTIGFARVFAAVFELPFQRPRATMGIRAQPPPRAQGVPA